MTHHKIDTTVKLWSYENGGAPSEWCDWHDTFCDKPVRWMTYISFNNAHGNNNVSVRETSTCNPESVAMANVSAMNRMYEAQKRNIVLEHHMDHSRRERA